MADIQLTSGKDKVTQTSVNGYDTYYAKEGDDEITLISGSVLGGAGNDIITRTTVANEWWWTVTVAYWDSPAAVVVDLDAGYADDGWGTRDTITNVNHVTGSWFGNTIWGSSASNEFWAGGAGSNVLDGRGGVDTIYLPNPGNKLTMADFKIETSVDGLTATITSTHAELSKFSITASNMERVGITYGVTYALSDYIAGTSMAAALLAGGAHRWNASAAMGTAVEIPFNFITTAPANGIGATGFQAFTAAQQATVRSILAEISTYAGISFKETTDPSGKGLHFGASQQANTKGVASLPGDTTSGQVWMDIETLANLKAGSEGYAVLLHEIAHALGLRHPRNVESGDAYAVQWRAEDDTTGRTVMSLTASADGMFPSMLSAYDITALRQLYGSKQVNLGDTTYALSGLSLSSQTALVDDGGTDTIDASAAAAGVFINLTPGRLSSIGVSTAGLAGVDNLSIEVNTSIENLVGSAFDDYLLGNSLGNRITGGLGNDWIEGGSGTDIAVFTGKRDDYLVSTGFGKWFVTARDGTGGFDTLVGMEQLAFADASLTLNAGALGSDADLSVDQNSSVSGSLPATSDGASASYSITSQPSHGTLTLSANGSFSYTPNTGMSGSDAFSFTLKDSAGISNVYRGFVSVRGVLPTLKGSDGNETIAGTTGNDLLNAGAGNDRITATAGSDSLDGGAGIDMVIYSGTRSAFTLSMAGTTLAVAKGGGANDYLVNVERIKFNDVAVAFDVSGSGGAAYRVYQAAFDRTPDRGGLGFWMAQMDNGLSQVEVARGFMSSQEFKDLYGAAPTAEQFVTKLYFNVLHRAPEKAGYDFWVSVVAGGYDRAEVLAAFAESSENYTQLVGVMSAGMAYDPFGA